MKIGIIIHSHTGNTLTVAEKIREALFEQGHNAEVRRVRAVNEDPSSSVNLRLAEEPDAGAYDALVFGAPVRAFSLSPVMALYFKGLAPRESKPAACFVTQHFKRPWMGGNRAVKQMRAACAAAGAQVLHTGVVNWSGPLREQQTDEIVKRFSKAF